MDDKHKMYALDMHEQFRSSINSDVTVIRVPGGWIYKLYDTSAVFVPYGHEFKPRYRVRSVKGSGSGQSGSQTDKCKEFVSYWNEIHNLTGKNKLRVTKNRKVKVSARLDTFSMDELKVAAKNRLEHTRINKWFQQDENKHFITSIDSFIRNDERVEKYLRIEDESAATPAKRTAFQFE